MHILITVKHGTIFIYCPPGLQLTQTLPCHPAPHLPSLATHHSLYLIQDPGTDLPNGELD